MNSFLKELDIKENNFGSCIGGDTWNQTHDCGEIISHKQAKALYEKSLKGDKYHNDIYIVDVYRGHDADDMVLSKEMLGKCTYISIKRHDKDICNDWRDFQQIKNELVGEDIEAIQIYPTKRIVGSIIL